MFIIIYFGNIIRHDPLVLGLIYYFLKRAQGIVIILFLQRNITSVIISRIVIFIFNIFNSAKQRISFVKFFQIEIAVSLLKFGLCHFFIRKVIYPGFLIIGNCFSKLFFLIIIVSEFITHHLPVDNTAAAFHIVFGLRNRSEEHTSELQ